MILKTVLFLGTELTWSVVTRLLAGWCGFRIPVEEIDFSLLQHIQTGSGDHPASYSKGKRFFPGDTAAGAW